MLTSKLMDKCHLCVFYRVTGEECMFYRENVHSARPLMIVISIRGSWGKVNCLLMGAISCDVPMIAPIY